MMCSREVGGVLLCLALTAAAGVSPAGLTIIDDVKPGATPVDTLVSVRERIRAAQAGDPLRKVLADADFGPALNAELSKFDNAHTVFWRGSATREEAIARAESADVRPRAAIGAPRPRDADYWWQALKGHEYARSRLPDAVDLVMVGDSITAGWSGAASGDWIRRLRADYAIHNLGIGSDRCENILWRMENGELDGYRAKRVVILTGERHVGEKPEDVVRGIGAVVKEAKARQPGAQIVVLGVLPYGGPHAAAASAPNVWRLKVNVALMKMAKDADVSFLDVSPDFRLPNGDTDLEMMPSDVHPSKKGFAALERRLASVGGRTWRFRTSAIRRRRFAHAGGANPTGSWASTPILSSAASTCQSWRRR